MIYLIAVGSDLFELKYSLIQTMNNQLIPKDNLLDNYLNTVSFIIRYFPIAIDSYKQTDKHNGDWHVVFGFQGFLTKY